MQVKKIIYPDKMLDKENIIRVAKHNIKQQWKETSAERKVSYVLLHKPCSV